MPSPGSIFDEITSYIGKMSILRNSPIPFTKATLEIVEGNATIRLQGNGKAAILVLKDHEVRVTGTSAAATYAQQMLDTLTKFSLTVVPQAEEAQESLTDESELRDAAVDGVV